MNEADMGKEQMKELNELADTKTNFAVVCKGTFRDFAKLKMLLEELDISIVYQTTSQNKLIVRKEGEKEEGEH